MFKHSAADVYVGSNGDVTKAFYAELEKRGPLGMVAMNLFRAQKCSARAKMYRRRAHKGEAYDRKNWSMGLLCEALVLYEASRLMASGPFKPNLNAIAFAPLVSPINYGWKQDPGTPGFEWVLYVDLPQGQVSFHAASRGAGPDYAGEWCGEHLSAERVVEFCDAVMAGNLTAKGAEVAKQSQPKTNRKAQALASQAALFTDASKGAGVSMVPRTPFITAVELYEIFIEVQLRFVHRG